MRRWLAALLAAAFTQSVLAADNSLGGWSILTVNTPLGAEGTPWRFVYDGQYRAPDFGNDVHQTVFRPGISYRLDAGPTLTLGYGHFRTRRPSGQHVVEHRLWQQVGWTARRSERGTLTMRFRLAQRDVEVGNDLGWWLRYRARYAYRLTGRWQASLFVEPFVDLTATDWGGDSGMRQNRVFLGLEHRLTERLALEVGYLNQYLWVDDRDNRSNHLAVLALNTRW